MRNRNLGVKATVALVMTSRDLDLLPLAVAGLLVDAIAFAWQGAWTATWIYLALAIIPVARKRWADRQDGKIPARRVRRVA